MEHPNKKVFRRKYADLIPELPFEKEFHLFVCYINNNTEEVINIVRNLEDFGVKCCYHERDFTPGQMVMDNMHDGIRKSVGMLIVLSEEFVSSRYCKFEIKEALHLHITEGYTIIPIKIEPCAVPETIQNITHIDVSQDEEGIGKAHLKIIKTIISQEKQEEEKRRNGVCRRYPVKMFFDRKLSFPRYKLQISPDERQSLREAGYEGSDELLDTTEKIINESALVRYRHIYDNLICILSIVAFISSFLLALIIMCLLMASEESPPKSPNVNPVGNFIAVSVPTLFVGWGILILSFWYPLPKKSKHCYWKALDHLQKQEQRRLNNALWDQVTKCLGRKSKLFFFYDDNSLIVMRLNLKPCKDVFLRNLKKRNESVDPNNDQELAARTELAFEMFLRNEIHLLNIKSKLLPKQSAGHPLETEAKCPCLLIRERVFNEV